MLKIPVKYIKEGKGYDIDLNARESWLKEILSNLFQEESLDLQSVQGQIHLDNFKGNITVSGKISFSHYPYCARCGEELNRYENINLKANILPIEAMDGEKYTDEEQEKELTSYDLDFAFYEGEDILIDPIVNDEIALALPYNYYCPDEVACEKRVTSLQTRHSDDSIDPRWAALKTFKVKNKA